MVKFSLVNPITGPYVVMVNYNSEGWKISKQCSTLSGAFAVRELERGLGNNEVMIFKVVNFDITSEG